MSRPSLLLIHVDEPHASGFQGWAERHGFGLLQPSEIASLVAPTDSLCLAVVGMRFGDVRDLFGRVAALRKIVGCPIVALGEGLGVRAAVDLVRLGASDVVDAGEDVLDVVERTAENAFGHLNGVGKAPLVGDSEAMRLAKREIVAVAPLDSTVLLVGETGTGKGLAARMVHDLSRRRGRPFVHVDCGALAASVVESELFGHERGAFTGATEERRGRFELAAGGTLFLDEVGELEPRLQTKLLRVLQDREFERLGGTRSRSMTARIVAATNRDLTASVRAGTFRQDLFFRLSVVRIEMPPLRLRREDIPGLIRAGLSRLGERMQIPSPELPDRIYRQLCGFSWPGNVRQLMNALEAIVVRQQAGLLDADDAEWIGALGEGAVGEGERAWERHRVTTLAVDARELRSERDRIEAELLATGGNVSRVARRLGLPRSTLRYKIRQYGLLALIPND